MNVTEKEARKIVGEEYCEWLDEKALSWSESLPYSSLPGWSGNRFSIIFDDTNMENLEAAKLRYFSVMKTS